MKDDFVKAGNGYKGKLHKDIESFIDDYDYSSVAAPAAGRPYSERPVTGSRPPEERRTMPGDDGEKSRSGHTGIFAFVIIMLAGCCCFLAYLVFAMQKTIDDLREENDRLSASAGSRPDVNDDSSLAAEPAGESSREESGSGLPQEVSAADESSSAAEDDHSSAEESSSEEASEADESNYADISLTVSDTEREDVSESGGDSQENVLTDLNNGSFQDSWGYLIKDTGGDLCYSDREDVKIYVHKNDEQGEYYERVRIRTGVDSFEEDTEHTRFTVRDAQSADTPSDTESSEGTDGNGYTIELTG